MQINFGHGFGNFGHVFNGFEIDMMELHIEIKLGNEIIKSQYLQMPYDMMRNQCQLLVNEIAQSDKPLKITMTGTKDIELPNGEWVSKPSKLIYANNAYTNNFDDMKE